MSEDSYNAADTVRGLNRIAADRVENAPNTERPRLIKTIAEDIREHWRKKDGSPAIYFGAVPYLEAMQTLHTIDDTYGFDTGKSIVIYFLANANTFRGEHARRIKAELKAML